MAGYVKGDIVLTPFPFSGEEGFKTRPALILAVLPFLLDLDSMDIAGGRLTQKCYLRPTYTYAVSEHMIKRQIGRLKAEKLGIAVQSLVSALTK